MRRQAGPMLCRLLVGLLSLGGCLLPVGSAGAAADAALPDFDTVRAGFRSSETLLLDRHGRFLHRLRTDFRVRRGGWVGLQDISPALRQALLLSEDRRFHQHSGVDWWAVSAAAWGNLWHDRTRGASTLTMQLAGLLEPTLRRPGGTPRDLSRKIAQAGAARELESHWRKDQILEAYLNLVPFRGEIIGIDALSRTLFGKTADALNAPESSLAAALIRAPNAPAPQVADRACRLLQQMQQAAAGVGAGNLGEAGEVGDEAAGKHDSVSNHLDENERRADCLSVEVLAGMTLHRRDWPASEGIAPHLAQRLIRQVLRRRDGDAMGIREGRPVVRSTLDAGIQRLAIEILRTQLRELRGRHVEDGAVVVLDNASGDVLAWVGSSGSLSQAAQVDGVMARRQPGSALKPFLYAQALAEHRLTAASLLDDSPAQLPTSGGLYMPQNYDHRYQGWVSVRTALAASLNIPAVRTLVMVSPEAFMQQLQRLDLRFPEGSGYYGYSLALGSAEVSLLPLTNAYRALANGGRWCPVHLLAHRDGESSRADPASAHTTDPPATVQGASSGPAGAPSPRPDHDGTPPWQGPEGCRQVLDAGAAFIVGDILSDRHARLPTFGSDSVLDTRFWSAVKTGTSKDMRDNWALGYSQRYTVGVWVGNAGGSPMHDVSGTSGAAPVWAALMRELHRHDASRPPRPPAGVVRQRVDFGVPSEVAGVNAAGPRVLSGQHAAGTDDRGAHGVARPGIEPARQEWFLAGTGQRHFTPPGAALAGDGRPAGAPGAVDGGLPIRIVAPAPGTLLALDPDIPPANQRLWLQAGPGAPADLHWFIDDRPVGRGVRVGWLPLPGRHTIVLRDARGELLDECRIEVRGAWLRPADLR